MRDTHSISAIVIDPKDPNVVYAASMGHVSKADPDRGVFKSTDGGKSWNKILLVDDNTGAICLVMDPNHADVLYATMWQAVRMPWGLIRGGPGSGIYKSTDGGDALAEDDRAPAENTPSRSLPSGLDLYLCLRRLQSGAHAQPGRRSSGDVSRGRRVSAAASS